MPRFGKWEIYHKEIVEAGSPAKLFVKIFGCSSYTAINFFNQMNLILPPGKNYSRILDAGCGKGDFTFYFAEKYPDSTIEGWDKSDEDMHNLGENIDVCNQIKEVSGLDNCRFEKKDLLEMSDSETYDLIFSIHVLEHIPNNEKVIRNFYKALKPDGLLHIQMPSNIEVQFYFLKKFTDMDAWAEEEHIGEHYSLEELTQLLQKTGFKILKSKTDGHFLSKHLFDILETLRRRKLVLLYAPFILIAKGLNYLLRHADNGKGNLIILAQKPNIAETII